MSEKIDPGIIRKYTSGHYTFRDLKQIARWFRDDTSHDELMSAVHSNWDEFNWSEGLQGKDLSFVYNNLRKKILAEKKSFILKQKVLKVYSRVAAILLLPLLIYSSYTITNRLLTKPQNARWVEVVSPYGTRTRFDLPDGTKVSMNSGTRIRYSADFRKERKLRVEGEAYFDVHHDASSPFTVQAGVMNVTALGTKFSVTSFPNENSADVVLEEGKVQITGSKNLFSELLSPGEKFAYDRESKRGTIEKVDAKYLTSWKDGLLMFRGEPLGEVMKRIGRWYNVKFEIADPEVEKFRYRATFRDEPLEEVIRLISLTAPIKYEIKERKMNNNDQYEEKTVVIRLKK